MATIMQQPQPIQPPLWFPLSTVSASKAMVDITNITGNFKDMDCKYAQSLLMNLMRQNSRGRYETVGYIPAPPSTMNQSQEIIKQVIGKDGCYFKKTTENCGIDFIYYDQEHEAFMFWGATNFTVTNAMKIIRNRICRITTKQFAKPRAAQTVTYMQFDADGEHLDPEETQEIIITKTELDINELSSRVNAISVAPKEEYEFRDEYGIVCI